MNTRVSEVVTTDHIKQWNQGDIITIKAGTGAGKSYFIKNILYAFAKRHNKKILFLIHRNNCVDQFKKEIEKDNKTNTIKIQTYQHIENVYRKYGSFNFNNYDYIVCDEFHYFLSDAAFNKMTDISLNTILDQQKITKIFMSATGNHMINYINTIKKLSTLDYELPIDYSFIEKLFFFYKEQTLERHIETAIETNQKAIFFIDSVEKAYALYTKYKEYCLFNCSKHNKKYYKHVKKKKINEMLINERFEELILITTTCMDAGVNIIDKDLKHIICDVKDVGTLIQCIGRKRIINENDKICLVIKAKSNKQLGAIKSQLKRKIKQAEYLRDNGIQEYIKEYGRNADKYSIVYDDLEYGNPVKRINKLMYFKCTLDVSYIDTMLKYGKYGYTKALSDKFKINYTVYEVTNKMDEIKTYLKKSVGKKLFKDERNELINTIGLKDSRERIQKSISIFNSYFKENKLEYMIVSRVTSELINGSKKSIRYWEIIDNVEN